MRFVECLQCAGQARFAPALCDPYIVGYGHGHTELPVTGTFCGLPGTLSLITNVSLLVPPEILSKVIVTAHDAPTARLVAQELAEMEKSKPSARLILEMAIVPLPELVRVTFRLGRGAVAATDPKLTDVGEMLMACPLPAVTESDTVVVLLSVPLVPATVIGKVPAGVVVEVESVRVEEPDVAIKDGLKLAVAPAGNPVALRLTFPVKPPVAATVTVVVPLLPAVSVMAAGEADSEKFAEFGGGGSTQLFATLENSSWMV